MERKGFRLELNEMFTCYLGLWLALHGALMGKFHLVGHLSSRGSTHGTGAERTVRSPVLVVNWWGSSVLRDTWPLALSLFPLHTAMQIPDNCTDRPIACASSPTGECHRVLAGV